MTVSNQSLNTKNSDAIEPYYLTIPGLQNSNILKFIIADPTTIPGAIIGGAIGSTIPFGTLAGTIIGGQISKTIMNILPTICHQPKSNH